MRWKYGVHEQIIPGMRDSGPHPTKAEQASAISLQDVRLSFDSFQCDLGLSSTDFIYA